MKKMILRGCVFCSATILGTNVLCASVQAKGGVQANTVSSKPTDIFCCGIMLGSTCRCIRCAFCGCILLADEHREGGLEASPEDRREPETFTLGCDLGTSMADTADALQEETADPCFRQPISLRLDSYWDASDLRQEEAPDDAALPASSKKLLRSEKTEQPDKCPSKEKRNGGDHLGFLDTLRDLPPTGVCRCDLMAFYRDGCISFTLSSLLNPRLLEPTGRVFLRTSLTLDEGGGGATHNFPEPDQSIFWLKGTTAYRRNVWARLRGSRQTFDWKGYCDDPRIEEWRRKSACVVPEPKTAVLCLLGCLILLHARSRNREFTFGP